MTPEPKRNPQNRSPVYHPASTDADLLPWVDEQDCEIGALPRAEIHGRNLLHRAVNIAVIDEQDRVWLQLRNPGKDAYGGWWDLSCTGHVDPGETYAAAALRELREELGISLVAEAAAQLRPVLKFKPTPASGWEFHMLYWLRHNGPFDFDPAEIVEMRPLTIAELHAALTAPDPALPLTPGVHSGMPHILRAGAINLGGLSFPDSGRAFELP